MKGEQKRDGNVPEGITCEERFEGTEDKNSKENKDSGRQDRCVKFFRGFLRVPAQTPSMVEAKAGGEERNSRDEEDAVDIGHLNIYKLGCVG